MDIKTKDSQKIKETILLVDDEQLILELTGEMLARNGYSAITAGSGEAAIDIYKIKKDQISLVFLDVEMPGMDGHICFEKLQKINPEIKVIIATGYPSVGKIKDTLDAGAVGYIRKPYKSSDMVKKAKEILDKREVFN